jgi:hypothetical protein
LITGKLLDHGLVASARVVDLPGLVYTRAVPESIAPALVLGPLLRHVGPTHATVWVQTSAPCVVDVLGHRQRTFTVAGHHYALVVVRDLAPATTTPYRVRLDDQDVWPPAEADDVAASRFPASTIRTPARDGEAPAAVRVAFGSCRYASPSAMGADRLDPCALDALARDLATAPPDGPDRPDLLLLLGDQVYADETTPGVRRRIHARRGTSAPRYQAADYQEYTWLYQESWSDPEVRWLFSVIPTAMIFDDHDVHDDWNTSRSWRQDAQATSWWGERITAALVSYWVYQHLGNLSPDELDAEPTYSKILGLTDGVDAEPLLRDLARAADREADGAKGYRWSFVRDLPHTRIVVLDSRCGRVLDGARSMLGEAEFSWAADRLLESQADHLLVGSSLPWLLAPALHDIEAWDERLADDHRPRRAAIGEKLRRAGDLEHWAAFRASFLRLADLLTQVGRQRTDPDAGTEMGSGGRPPATVAVLSGDVHHSYVARTRTNPPVCQVTCSPLHNTVPWFMRIGFRLAWSRTAERATRTVLGRWARVPTPGIGWDRTAGPFFGNAVGMITIEGRRSRLTLLSSRIRRDEPDGPHLHAVHDEVLGPG